MSDDGSYFDNVNFRPNEWVQYEKGTVVACDDLGACTVTIREDGWYLMEPHGSGSCVLWQAGA